MVTRTQVIAEARQWLGTRFHHQGHAKGVGCDCAGLVGGVCVALGLLPADFWETQFARFAGYGRQPHAGLLEAGCAAFLEPVHADSIQLADVLLFRFEAEPQHVGFVGDYVHGGFSVIHSLSTERKVVEHRLDSLWLSRVTGAYQIRGIL